MDNRGINYELAGKKLSLYLSHEAGRPLIVLNNFADDGGEIVRCMAEINCPDCNLLSIGNLNWEEDMTPWSAPALMKNEPPFTGKADEYLNILVDEIIPDTEKRIKGRPEYIGIAGYSLAGLFALYSIYKCQRFGRVASMSGSLWFPDFKDYVLSNKMQIFPKKIYLSLGDKESKTKNPLLKTVGDSTEEIYKHFLGQGLDVCYEINQGNHFKDAPMRTAKGIAEIVGD
ncbi:MAG: alpha/beta hydrolase [Pseudobutyrivibrio sp.]|nr:alpha/beta hydrolase [Pseudobutyrivibrio sp.]